MSPKKKKISANNRTNISRLIGLSSGRRAIIKSTQIPPTEKRTIQTVETYQVVEDKSGCEDAVKQDSEVAHSIIAGGGELQGKKSITQDDSDGISTVLAIDDGIEINNQSNLSPTMEASKQDDALSTQESTSTVLDPNLGHINDVMATNSQSNVSPRMALSEPTDALSDMECNSENTSDANLVDVSICRDVSVTGPVTNYSTIANGSEIQCLPASDKLVTFVEADHEVSIAKVDDISREPDNDQSGSLDDREKHYKKREYEVGFRDNFVGSDSASCNDAADDESDCSSSVSDACQISESRSRSSVSITNRSSNEENTLSSSALPSSIDNAVHVEYIGGCTGVESCSETESDNSDNSDNDSLEKTNSVGSGRKASNDSGSEDSGSNGSESDSDESPSEDCNRNSSNAYPKTTPSCSSRIHDCFCYCLQLVNWNCQQFRRCVIVNGAKFALLVLATLAWLVGAIRAFFLIIQLRLTTLLYISASRAPEMAQKPVSRLDEKQRRSICCKKPTLLRWLLICAVVTLLGSYLSALHYHNQAWGPHVTVAHLSVHKNSLRGSPIRKDIAVRESNSSTADQRASTTPQPSTAIVAPIDLIAEITSSLKQPSHKSPKEARPPTYIDSSKQSSRESVSQDAQGLLYGTNEQLGVLQGDVDSNFHNLVLASVSGALISQIAVFIASLRANTPDADVVIFSPTPFPDRFAELSSKYGVVFVGFNKEKLLPGFLQQYHDLSLRWILYYRFMRNNHRKLLQRYDRVMIAEIQETLFQGNIFVLLPANNSFYAFTAQSKGSQTISSTPLLKNWIESCFHRQIVIAVQQNPVISTAVSMGSFDRVFEYITIMGQLMLGEDRLSDQFPRCQYQGVDAGVHNVLVHLGFPTGVKVMDETLFPLILVPPGPSTFGSIDELKFYRVVHGYSGVKPLAQYSFNRYVHWKTGISAYSLWKNEPSCEGYHTWFGLNILPGSCSIAQVSVFSIDDCCSLCVEQKASASKGRKPCTSFVHTMGQCSLFSCEYRVIDRALNTAESQNGRSRSDSDLKNANLKANDRALTELIMTSVVTAYEIQNRQ